MLDRYRYDKAKCHVPMTEFIVRRKEDFDTSRGDLVGLNCMICGGDSFEELGQVDRYGFYYPTGLCRSCGNVQQTEYYSRETLDDFYANYYRDIYGNQSAEDLFKDQMDRGDAIRSFVVSSIPDDGHILEVGAGAGGILKVFMDAGDYDVQGLDFDERYIEYGRSQGVQLTRGGLEEIGDGKKFDLVILSHVLEHIVDQASFIGDVMRSLKDGGKIYIEVPSLNFVLDGGYEFDLLLYYQNAHVIHYSIDTLGLMLEQCGLNVLKIDPFIRCLVEKTKNHVMDQEERFRGVLQRQRDLMASIERRRRWRQYPLPKKISKKFIRKFI